MSRPSLVARLLRRWHKQIGLLAAAFFAFLAISGLALNHGDVLDLDKTELSTPWLMAWYGLKPAVPEYAYALDGGFFSAQGGIWTLAGRRVRSGHGEPLGAVGVGDFYWVATSDEINLYDHAGSPVDRIGHDLLPAVPVRRIGTWQGRLAVNAGSNLYSSEDGIAWETLPARATVAWSRHVPLPEAQRRELAPLFAPALPLQRIVADTHSGRIFGRYGILVTDVLSIILLLLAGSGCWLYLSTRVRKNKANNARQAVAGGDHPLPPG